MWRSSPTQSRGLGGHLNAQEGEDKVKLNQESQARHLLAEKGEDQIQRTPEHYGGHLHEEKDKIKSNSPKKMPWWSPVCRGKLGRNFAFSFFVALMIRFASIAKFLQSISISNVTTAHIFFLDFWTILLKSKTYILSLSLSAANWRSFLKQWQAFEVSLSLIWNNWNVNT